MASAIGLFGDKGIVSYLMSESPNGLFQDASTVSHEERARLFHTFPSVAYVYHAEDAQSILTVDDFLTCHANCGGSCAVFVVPFLEKGSSSRPPMVLHRVPTVVESANHYHSLFTLLQNSLPQDLTINDHCHPMSISSTSNIPGPVLAPVLSRSQTPKRSNPGSCWQSHGPHLFSSRWMKSLEKLKTDELCLDNLVTRLWVAFMMLLDAKDLPKYRKTDIRGRISSNIFSNQVDQSLHGFLCYLLEVFPTGRQSWPVFSDFRYHVGRLGDADIVGEGPIDKWVILSPAAIHEIATEHGFQKSVVDIQGMIAGLSVWPGNSLYLATLYKQTDVSELYHSRRWWRGISRTLWLRRRRLEKRETVEGTLHK